jgi:hypothetical protein
MCCVFLTLSRSRSNTVTFTTHPLFIHSFFLTHSHTLNSSSSLFFSLRKPNRRPHDGDSFPHLQSWQRRLCRLYVLRPKCRRLRGALGNSGAKRWCVCVGSFNSIFGFKVIVFQYFLPHALFDHARSLLLFFAPSYPPSLFHPFLSQLSTGRQRHTVNTHCAVKQVREEALID